MAELMTRLEPADVIDTVLCDWNRGHFKEARDLAQAAMTRVGITPPYIDISLEHLAADLIENDNRRGGN
jgi:hypothetical protein